MKTTHRSITKHSANAERVCVYGSDKQGTLNFKHHSHSKKSTKHPYSWGLPEDFLFVVLYQASHFLEQTSQNSPRTKEYNNSHNKVCKPAASSVIILKPELFMSSAIPNVLLSTF